MFIFVIVMYLLHIIIVLFCSVLYFIHIVLYLIIIAKKITLKFKKDIICS